MLILMALGNKYVRRYRLIIYIAVFAFTLYYVLGEYLLYTPIISGRDVTMTLAKGALSTCVFAVVAYIGVLPSNNVVVQRLRSVRTELSVIGCILAYCQILFFANYLKLFFTGDLGGVDTLGTLCTILLYIIMLPLWFTSFYCVRTNMKQTTWKKVQKLAYVFYFLLWAHVFVLYASFSGGIGEIFSSRDGTAVLYYTILWGVYFVLRFCKFLYDRYAGDKGGKRMTADEELEAAMG